MTEEDIEAELLAAAARMSMGQVRRIWALGADRRFVARLIGAEMLGIGRVTLSRDGSRWEPGGPDGRLLIGAVDAGALVDVVAVSTSHPDQWALRTGHGWALGCEAIERVHAALAEERRPVLALHANPIDWLRAGGEGVCVLDWSRAALAELRALGERATIEVGPGAAAQLKGMLAYGGLPRVRERTEFGMGEAA